MGAIQLSGCVIINEKEELLLLWKIKRQHYELPGGKVEDGESLEEAAIRECKEELGVVVFLEKNIGFEDFEIEDFSFRSHMFAARIKTGQKPILAEPEVFEKLFYLPIAHYKEYSCAKNVVSFCEKYLEKTRNKIK